MNHDKTVIMRLSELADRSFKNNQFTFTKFLSMADASEYYEHYEELKYASPTVFGGCDEAERVIVRFGNPEELGYEEAFPISYIEISPLQEKFSDDLGHRDFLGALMNLNIERDMCGDIFVNGNRAYIICLESMAEYIVNNLTKVKHTSVKTVLIDSISDITLAEPSSKIIQVSSHRIDAVISKVYNISRSNVLELFRKNLVFLNGRICTENSKMLKEKDVISTRGYGKMVFQKVMNINKKQKENCQIDVY